MLLGQHLEITQKRKEVEISYISTTLVNFSTQNIFNKNEMLL